jgi:hypothetical protein
VSVRPTVVLLSAALVFYLLLAVERGVWLLRQGGVVPVAFGLAVLLLPLFGGWFLWQEIRFGLAAERVWRDLDAEGGLPSDELPRRPSGRVDLAAADEVFARRRAEVEKAPDDWRAWLGLAAAYSEARDTARARAATRRAIALHRGRR